MRTHYCGDLTIEQNEHTVTLCGWVQRWRDHGGVIFIDLRDCRGIVQVVCHPDNPQLFSIAEGLHNEYVIQVQGVVRQRPEGTINTELDSGHIEVVVMELTVLNSAETLPFQIDEHHKISEELRLRYRYLDLRRRDMLARFQLRSQLHHCIHRYFDKAGFMHVETPCLTKATPEGARDYLVPSRVHAGEFYALPQSPQIFKQLLMMSGLDRYYQIVRCFRDEDLRADRQPEFTQLDLEMSFCDEAMIQQEMENFLCTLFKEVLQVELPQPFPRMTYQVAMERYGSDKPDLRIPLELVEVSDLVKDVEFKVFATPANDPRSRVAALKVPGGCDMTRKQIDDYTQFVAIYGAKGLAYIRVNDRAAGVAGLQSPILKFFPEAVILNILDRLEAQTDDLIFFGADQSTVVSEALGALRVKLGHDRHLIPTGWQPVWIVDFPMFAWNDSEHRWDALHHPFTAPNTSLEAMQANPGDCLSRAYDLALNGMEVGGGSIRIHDIVMQQAVFELLGIAPDLAQAQFGHLLQAMRLGCPPHAGIAFGLDRLAMLMAGCDSIRDVIAFPKTQSAHCPLTNAPSAATKAQLKELALQVVVPPKADNTRA